MFMHWDVIGYPPTPLEVDHIDRNTLNNCRANLRFVTHREQMLNRARWRKAQFTGVEEKRGRWRARISVNRQRVELGTFSTPEEAAAAYNQAARRLNSEFAQLNPV